MPHIGYARVSTDEQNLDAQLDELKKRCDKVFTDKISGVKSERPGLQQCLEYMRAGDVLVITKLDRLARSLKDLIEIVSFLKEREIAVVYTGPKKLDHPLSNIAGRARAADLIK